MEKSDWLLMVCTLATMTGIGIGAAFDGIWEFGLAITAGAWGGALMWLAILRFSR